MPRADFEVGGADASGQSAVISCQFFELDRGIRSTPRFVLRGTREKQPQILQLGRCGDPAQDDTSVDSGQWLAELGPGTEKACLKELRVVRVCGAVSPFGQLTRERAKRSKQSSSLFPGIGIDSGFRADR